MSYVRFLISIVLVPATLGALLSLGSMFSAYHLIFDLLSHFRVQYIVVLLPAFLLAAFAKKTIPILIISFALAVHGYAVAVSWLPVSTRNDTDYVELSILNSNLLLVNTNYQAQLDIIKAQDPDLIAFQEYTPKWHVKMSKALSSYPHRITQPAEGSFGIGLFSKHPITDGAVEKFSTKSFPAINADIKINKFNVRVLVIHPPPPTKQRHYRNRNLYLERIAIESKAHDGAMLVVGDFNSTPWTSHFTKMLKVGRLRDARAGHGFHPTWPTPIPTLRVPIDHILVNSKIDVDHFESIHLEGSDHRNIFGRVRVY